MGADTYFCRFFHLHLYKKWFVTLGISVWLFWNFQTYSFHLYFVDRTHKLIFHIHMKLVEYNFALRIDLFYILWATSRCYHGSRVQCKCGIWCNKYLLFLHNSSTTERSGQTGWLWISIILSHMFTYGLFFSMSLHYKNPSSYYQTIAYSRHDMNCSWQIDDLLWNNTHLSAFKEHAFIFGLTLAPLDVFWGISYFGPLSLTLLYLFKHFLWFCNGRSMYSSSYTTFLQS